MIRLIGLVFISLGCLSAAQCASKKYVAEQQKVSEDVEMESSLTAVAIVEQDDTINVRVRLVSPSGAVGETVWTYLPTDPKYREVLEFLGEPEQGEYVSRDYWPYELAPER